MRLRNVFLTKSWIIALVLAGGYALVQQPVLAQETQEQESTQEQVRETTQTQTRWHEQAEQSLGIGKGLAKKLMTQEEWREHHRKMQTMTKEEREQYRKEVHQQMVERAKEKGISMPETTGPRGPNDKPDSSGKGRGGRGR